MSATLACPIAFMRDLADAAPMPARLAAAAERELCAIELEHGLGRMGSIFGATGGGDADQP